MATSVDSLFFLKASMRLRLLRAWVKTQDPHILAVVTLLCHALLKDAALEVTAWL
jgi:hypothetical protein